MSKNTCLEKAYYAAYTNQVIRSVDERAAKNVIKLGMIEYAKRNHVKVSKDEVESYINRKNAEMKKAFIDFGFQSKIMN